jgi:hypothetical protein
MDCQWFMGIVEKLGICGNVGQVIDLFSSIGVQSQTEASRKVIGSLGHWVIGSLGHWVIEKLFEFHLQFNNDLMTAKRNDSMTP